MEMLCSKLRIQNGFGYIILSIVSFLEMEIKFLILSHKKEWCHLIVIIGFQKKNWLELFDYFNFYSCWFTYEWIISMLRSLVRVLIVIVHFYEWIILSKWHKVIEPTNPNISFNPINNKSRTTLKMHTGILTWNMWDHIPVYLGPKTLLHIIHVRFKTFFFLS